jgi:hypothetical protein
MSRASTGLVALRLLGGHLESDASRAPPCPAGPNSGRPGDRERARVRKAPSQPATVVRRAQAMLSSRALGMFGGQPARRAERAREAVLKVLTRGELG